MQNTLMLPPEWGKIWCLVASAVFLPGGAKTSCQAKVEQEQQRQVRESEEQTTVTNSLLSPVL